MLGMREKARLQQERRQLNLRRSCPAWAECGGDTCRFESTRVGSEGGPEDMPGWEAWMVSCD